MITKINKTIEFKDKMRSEGNLISLNTPEDVQNAIEMNKIMEEVRRECIIKNAKSVNKASSIILI